jgi:predicted  nucleic acid-binding Zn-ribbon protein
MSDAVDGRLLRDLAAIRQQLTRIEGKQDEIIEQLAALRRDMAALKGDMAETAGVRQHGLRRPH